MSVHVDVDIDFDQVKVWVHYEDLVAGGYTRIPATPSALEGLIGTTEVFGEQSEAWSYDCLWVLIFFGKPSILGGLDAEKMAAFLKLEYPVL